MQALLRGVIQDPELIRRMVSKAISRSKWLTFIDLLASFIPEPITLPSYTKTQYGGLPYLQSLFAQ
jgi:hypothetical protein